MHWNLFIGYKISNIIYILQKKNVNTYLTFTI